SNRRPPPYHGGFGVRLCGVGNALGRALSLQSACFLRLQHPFLEGPSVALTDPEPVPRTSPQRSAYLYSILATGERRRSRTAEFEPARVGRPCREVGESRLTESSTGRRRRHLDSQASAACGQIRHRPNSEQLPKHVAPQVAGVVSSAGKQACEVPLDAVEFGAAAAVADVAVGSDQILRLAVDGQPGERLPVEIVEEVGPGFAGQP